jgi:hypothetical protein
MKSFVISLVAMLMLTVIGPAAAPAAESKGDYWRDCGERIVGEALIVQTKSHAVKCKLARKIAKEYAQGERHPIGFNCSEPEVASSFEVSKGTCRREGGRIKVIFGI